MATVHFKRAGIDVALGETVAATGGKRATRDGFCEVRGLPADRGKPLDPRPRKRF